MNVAIWVRLRAAQPVQADDQVPLVGGRGQQQRARARRGCPWPGCSTPPCRPSTGQRQTQPRRPAPRRRGTAAGTANSTNGSSIGARPGSQREPHPGQRGDGERPAAAYPPNAQNASRGVATTATVNSHHRDDLHLGGQPVHRRVPARGRARARVRHPSSTPGSAAPVGPWARASRRRRGRSRRRDGRGRVRRRQPERPPPTRRSAARRATPDRPVERKPLPTPRTP